jgi:hypothetical protein
VRRVPPPETSCFACCLTLTAGALEDLGRRAPSSQGLEVRQEWLHRLERGQRLLQEEMGKDLLVGNLLQMDTCLGCRRSRSGWSFGYPLGALLSLSPLTWPKYLRKAAVGDPSECPQSRSMESLAEPSCAGSGS